MDLRRIFIFLIVTYKDSILTRFMSANVGKFDGFLNRYLQKRPVERAGACRPLS